MKPSHTALLHTVRVSWLCLALAVLAAAAAHGRDTLAVVELYNGSGSHLPRFDEYVETATYRAFLRQGGLRVVDRANLSRGLSVLGLAPALVPGNPALAADLGRNVGADWLLSGRVLDYVADGPRHSMLLEIVVVDIDTSRLALQEIYEAQGVSDSGKKIHRELYDQILESLVADVASVVGATGGGRRPVGPSLREPASSTIRVVVTEPQTLVPRRMAGGQVPIVATDSLRIRGRIHTRLPLASLQVDGREITSLTLEDGDLTFQAFVPLEAPGRRTVDIVASDVAGDRWSETFVVQRAPRVETQLDGPGSRRALIVGISDYADSSIDLRYAAKDARALHEFLTAKERGPARFEPKNVRLLLDGDATVKEINSGLREFLPRAREGDFVLVFFAGHGAPDPSRLQSLYLLAHDTEPQNVAGTGIPMHHVREAVAELRSKDTLVLTDSCHSAGVAAPGSRSLMSNAIHSAFLAQMRHASAGLAILTASEAAQLSLEGPEWEGHGVFSYYLLKGLRGGADADGDRVVNLGEVMEYVRRQVMLATEHRQIPAIGPTSFDRRYPLVPVHVKN